MRGLAEASSGTGDRASIAAPIENAFQSAMKCHQGGNVGRAAEMYEEILRQAPEHAGAWHLLGVCCQQWGRVQQAIEYITKAISLDGNKAVYHNNLGVALRAAGRLDEARWAFQHALAIHPHYADAHSNLGIALHQQGLPEAALSCFQTALRLQPGHADALYNLGNVYHDLHRLNEAVGCYRQALRVRPNWAAAHNNLGNALFADERISESVAHYRQAAGLDPRNAQAHYNLGAAYARLEMTHDAARCYETASRLCPARPLWGIRSVSLCPAVFQDVAEIDEFRRRLEARLDACREEAAGAAWSELATEGFTPLFYLAHHGTDNRPLKEKFAAVFEPLVPRARPRVRTGKPRIGFLVTRRHEGGFLRSMSGIIERMDSKRFEPVVLCSDAVVERCRRGIARHDVGWVAFPDRFQEAVRRIAEAECDVLYHWQIGTDAMNYLLPFAGLAPVQCTGWGTHGTTGIAAVDYYLSSRLMEADGAEDHYTEALYRFETFPTYQRRVPCPQGVRRSQFRLPEEGKLYICPPRLAKFHPDLDELLGGVLRRDPKGYLVILKGEHEHPLRQLGARWERTLGDVLARVVFLPSQKPADFYRLLSLADVFLDTMHYSAGLMGHDAFSLHVPIVTLPGRFNVGRYTLGYYRRMGIDELVAGSPAEYVELAVRVGTDPDYRHHLKTLLAERSEVLFEDHKAVDDHDWFFEYALERARR